MVSLHLSTPGQELLAHLRPGRLVRFDLPSDFLGLHPPSTEVLPYLVRVRQIVGENSIDIGESERIVRVNNRLRRSAVVELLNEHFQQYARIAYANGAMELNSKRNRLRLK